MSHTERQDVTYYSGHVIEVNGKRYAPERTCTVSSWNYETYGDLSDIVLISCELSCGHGDDWFSIPDYCPTCGAKVIEEDTCR